MLLAASNHSLRLYGMDIVYDLCLCTELNGFLFVPWLVCMPPRVEEMFNTITGKTDYHGMPITLETNPETVEITQAYRQEQYNFQQSFMDDLNIKVVDISKPARSIAKTSVSAINVEQEEMF